VFVDFDGTLAPIVELPDQARALPGAAPALGRLAGRYARVAVISGRPVAFLAQRLGPAAGTAELVGLYGLERTRADGGTYEVDPAAAPWRALVDAAAAAAESAAPAGLRVERKGLAVTLHFRRAPELEEWAAEFAARQAAASGLVAQAGKKSWELRPPTRIDKGTVVAELAEGLGAVCFLGDDTGDLPAFAVLGRLRAGGVETLAVAVAGPETPEAVMAGADLVVEGPAGALALLETLAGGAQDP
jgi:trehalose 6-phosphate phosphatase